MKTSIWRKIWFAVFLLFGLGRAASAQSMGTINGRVTDPAGALIPGATVTATNAGTGVARTTVSGSDGLFTISELIPGTYDVTVDKTGFAKTEKKGSTLVTGTTLTLDFALGVAGTAERVEVTTEAPMVDLTQSVVSGTLQTSEVQNLPILNRNFSGLVTLIPGARPTAAATNVKVAEGGGIGFGGSAGRAGAAQVDGSVFRDDENGGTLFNLTLEGVQEFNVISHDYPAQYGQSSGGIVLITTKSGTNQFHGSAFAFGRSQAMTAIDYFSDPANGGLGKPPYDREQYGGSFGGPILKDKLFGFGAIERLQEDLEALFPASDYQDAVLVKNTLSAYSVAQCPYCALVGNAIVTSPYVPESFGIWYGSGRVDYQINPKQSLFVRWLRERDNNVNDVLEGSAGTPHPDIDPNGSNTSDIVKGDNLVLSETWLINNRTVNTASVTGGHYSAGQSCHCTLTGPNLIWRNITFADITVGETQGSVPQRMFEVPIQFKDDVAYEKGNHALKMGGEFITYPYLGFYLGNNPGGTTFSANASTIINNTNGLYPQGILTPGAMSSMAVSTIAYGGAPAFAAVQGGKEWAAYVQDDWKVRNNLTLNLGIRYGMSINFMNESTQNSNRALQLLKAIGSPFGKDVQTPTHDYSPRFGFVWNPDGKGKNVLRGSFGIYFDEALGANQLSVGPEAQPTLNNIVSTYTNSTVGIGAKGSIPSEVYGTSPIPTGPTVGATSYTAGSSSTATWLAPDDTDPYNEQTHVGYTRQLTSSTVLSADFTHILGLHEFRVELINPDESVNGVLSPWDPNAASYNTCGLTGTWRRLECAFRAAGVANNTIGTVNLETSGSRSIYDELDVHFEQRSRRATLQATYTYSSAYGWGGIAAGTASGGSIASEVPFQWIGAGEWGPTASDERNRAVISGVVNVPWGINVSPIFQVASARPYSCTAGSDYLGTGLSSVERCKIDSNGNPVALTSTSAVGIAPINYLRGQPTLNLDARVTKIQKFGERLTANFFAEFYNITNRANFGNQYQGSFTSATFEKPTGYLNGGVSLPTSRQLQLGARFTF